MPDQHDGGPYGGLSEAHPEHAETARTLEVNVEEHHDQLHIAVGYEGGDEPDYILVDKEWVAELVQELQPFSEAEQLTFNNVSVTNRLRAERWHGGFPEDGEWTLADWSNAMCGEAGEAANVVKKMRRYECGIPAALDPGYETLRSKLAEELADVLLYADLLATKAGINLPTAIVGKFNFVSEREGFPERLP